MSTISYVDIRRRESLCADNEGHNWDLVVDKDRNWPIGVVCTECGRDRQIRITERPL